MSTIISKNNISFSNQIQQQIRVKADKVRLGEIFHNLISNSVKYSKDDGGTIAIHAIEFDDKYAKISIQDDGIGITKENQKNIFNKFSKSSEKSKDMDNHGLGLSIVKNIVEEHGGRVWVESDGVGSGSTFLFTLPLSSNKHDK